MAYVHLVLALAVVEFLLFGLAVARARDRYHVAARTAAILLAHGRLQREDQVIHVLVHGLEDLTARLASMPSRSRDFR